MKKVTKIVLVLVVVMSWSLLLMGCVDDDYESFDDKRFEEIGYYYYKDTKSNYMYYKYSGDSDSAVPLFNSEGTPLSYEEFKAEGHANGEEGDFGDEY